MCVCASVRIIQRTSLLVRTNVSYLKMQQKRTFNAKGASVFFLPSSVAEVASVAAVSTSVS